MGHVEQQPIWNVDARITVQVLGFALVCFDYDISSFWIHIHGMIAPVSVKPAWTI